MEFQYLALQIGKKIANFFFSIRLDEDEERKPPAKRCYNEQVDNIISERNVETTKKSRQERYNKKFSKEKKEKKKDVNH